MLVVMMAMAAGNQIANVPFVGVSPTGIMEVNGPAGVGENFPSLTEFKSAHADPSRP